MLNESDRRMDSPISSGMTPPLEPENVGDQGVDAPESAPKPPLAELLALDPSQATDEQIQAQVHRYVEMELTRLGVGAASNFLFLYKSQALTRSDANRIYDAAAAADEDKPVVLVLDTPGGDLSAAYFIAKLCRENSNGIFEVAVPRQAKSAGTLICCAADKLHMGSLSELGPIDPQFGGIPALALKHSVEHLAQLASEYPGAANMLSDYLAKSLNVQSIGFYERVAESAVQYAVRLLNSRSSVNASEDDNLVTARHLVYAYKDHGFAIDAQEARSVLSSEVVEVGSPTYEVANGLYRGLDFLEFFISRRFDRDMSFVGSAANGCWVFKRDR